MHPLIAKSSLGIGGPSRRSLQGRYHFLRMHPFSVAELGMSTQADLDALVTLGAFQSPSCQDRLFRPKGGRESIERG